MSVVVSTSTAIAQMERENAERDRRYFAAHGAQVAGLLGRYSLLYKPATNPAERRSLAAEIFEPDGFYRDPMTGALGPSALVAHIEEVLFAILPGYELQRLGQLLLHGPYVAFSWHYLDPTGVPAVFEGSFGTDFVMLSPGGKLQSVVGFFGAALLPRPS